MSLVTYGLGISGAAGSGAVTQFIEGVFIVEPIQVEVIEPIAVEVVTPVAVEVLEPVTVEVE